VQRRFAKKLGSELPGDTVDWNVPLRNQTWPDCP
jgi:hypothetical protein